MLSPGILASPGAPGPAHGGSGTRAASRDRISARELELVTMLARGHTTDRVARELRLSRHTVGEEISVLLGKFNCANRAQLVAYWYVHGLLPVGVWPPIPAGLARRGGDHAAPARLGGAVTVMPDPLSVLRAAGYPVDQASAEQRAVLAGLTEQEVAILASVQSRLVAAAGDGAAAQLRLL